MSIDMAARQKAPTGAQETWLVDTTGEPMIEIEPPAPGSVLLVDGLLGTAWQRHRSDGKWHAATTAKSRTWGSFFHDCRNVVLVYAAAAPKPEPGCDHGRGASVSFGLCVLCKTQVT
jgi:hypothetical protein